MKAKFLCVGLTCLLLITFDSSRLAAHHSFGAEYDGDKPITLKGVVTRIDWENPHMHFYLDVKDENGNVTTWGFSGLPPGMAVRRGFTKETLKIGEPVVVQGFRAKDGSNNASGNILTFADGRQVFPGALEVGTVPATKP